MPEPPSSTPPSGPPDPVPRATAPPPPGGVPLPAELAAFWTAFTTQQFERGNRDVGRMVQTALEQFFNRGSERLAPALQAREELEAFGVILVKEIGRADRVLAGNADGKLAKSFKGHTYVLGTRKSPRRAAAEAVQTKALPRALATVADLRAYREGLAQQALAAERAADENMRVLMETREGLQRSLTALAPTLYSTAIALLDAHDAAQGDAASPVRESWPEAPPRPTATAKLPLPTPGSGGGILGFFRRFFRAIGAALRAWSAAMRGR